MYARCLRHRVIALAARSTDPRRYDECREELPVVRIPMRQAVAAHALGLSPEQRSWPVVRSAVRSTALASRARQG